MFSMTEFELKQKRIKKLLDQHGLDALLLQRASSFAWATCGAASFVNTASTFGASSLLITPTGNHLITNNIEASRLREEEKLAYQGWKFHVSPWHETPVDISKLAGNTKLGSDAFFPESTDLSTEIAHLRAELTAEESVRFRVLGKLCAEAMDSAARSLQPGLTEHQIAARLAHEAIVRGVQPIVNLVATDERISSFRHPLPTYKILERYAMLVLCGRRWGLVCSLTRLVNFGGLSDSLRQKTQAVAAVDAALIAATRPGTTLGEIFQRGVDAYAANGFADEWKLHHQGGAAGYEPREFLAKPESTELVSLNQAFAWNPSITGTKSEDTIQVGKDENEIITAIPGWPTLEVEINGTVMHRPAILEVM